MTIKVDLLLKDELIFELEVRNLKLSETSNVVDLRKMLRQAISQKIQVNYDSIKTKIVPDEEIDLISEKIVLIENKCAELTKDSRSMELARQDTRIKHCKHRLNALSMCSLTEKQKGECKELLEKCKVMKDKFEALEFDKSAVEMSIRKLSESNVEEENLENVFLEKDPDTSPSHPERKAELSRCKVPLLDSNACASTTPAPFDPQMYRKLPNPIETYLKDITTCNGLVTSELIEFIRILFKVQKETRLSDAQILEIFVAKSQSPLLDVMLSNLENNLEAVKEKIVKLFVPISVREDLIKQHVTRHQETNEPLPLYINRVKEYAKILNCSYTEVELVEFILIGLNPRCRVNLSLVRNLNTIADLEKACIHSLSIDVKNNLRLTEERSETVRRESQQTTQQRVPFTKKCYVCNREGHLARNCFRRDQYQKN